jgi:hypothetical protein
MIAFLATALLGLLPATVSQQAGETLWLAVSDVHLDPFDRSSQPSRYGRDSNGSLFRATLRSLKRALPNPPVVLLAGDFLVHDFATHAEAAGVTAIDASATETMRRIARAFAATFPSAQFAITLGNNDAPCGDYRSALHSRYLASVARAWEPMVNRRGAAPEFLSTFPQGGYYAARLTPRLRIIALDTVLFSHQYRGDCGPDARDAAQRELKWLRRVIAMAPPGVRTIVLMHVPPGFDAFATAYVHGFVAWPFLDAHSTAILSALVSDPANRVAFAVAGHAHRFDFRVAGNVPIVVLGSVSPIYGNNPTFYVLRVSADGSLRDIGIVAFDQPSQRWRTESNFDRAWGVAGIDGASLAGIHARLAREPAMRERWEAQSAGWPSQPINAPPRWGTSWRYAWCAQTLLDSGFTACVGVERRIELLRRWLSSAIVAGFVVTAIAALVRRRSGAPPPGTPAT